MEKDEALVVLCRIIDSAFAIQKFLLDNTTTGFAVLVQICFQMQEAKMFQESILGTGVLSLRPYGELKRYLAEPFETI